MIIIKHLRIFYLLLVFTVITTPYPSFSIDTLSVESDTKIIVARVIIQGNKKTKSKTILLYMDIDSGDVYDSAKVKIAEKKLYESGLFNRIKFFPIVNNNKVTLLVIVREKQYFSIGDFGGVIHYRRYGEKTDRLWLHGYGTLTFNNFGGRNEKLNISASLWRIRYIGVSWSKPLITTPYFIKLGTRIGTYPSIVTPWHINFFNSSFCGVGRQTGIHSNVSTAIKGLFKTHTWEAGKGKFYKNGTRQKKLSQKEELLNLGYEYNNSWTYTDTIIKYDINNVPIDTNYTVYKWVSYDSVYINNYLDHQPYKELFLSIGWKTDKRNKTYNPQKGYYLSINALTNALYAYDDPYLNKDEEKYLQLSTDFRLFHRGIWKNNTVSYRIRPLIRLFGRGNAYSGIYMGDERTLRGYGTGAFGSSAYNNRVLFSWEYRFPIYTLQELSFPWLSWYDKSLSNFFVRIDGALILDCGYLWKDAANLLHPSGDHASAAGTGFGLRFMFPSLQRSVCAEFIFPIAFPEGYFDESGYGIGIYLYLDLPF